MAHLKLYRKPGKKYRTELRPSRIDILILPLVVCFLISIVVWSYVTGHNRPEPLDTEPLVETVAPSEDAESGETVDGTEDNNEPAGPPIETEAQPSDI